MLKKLLPILLAIVMLSTVFACTQSGSEKSKVSNETEKPSAIPTEVPTEAPTEPMNTQVPNSLVPIVMVNGTLYFFNNRAIDEPEAEPSGRIKSIVPISERPTKDDEANLEYLLDAPYMILDGGVALKLESIGWSLFVPEEQLSK